MSIYEAPPNSARTDPTGRYKGNNFDPEYRKNLHHRRQYSDHDYDHRRRASDQSSHQRPDRCEWDLTRDHLRHAPPISIQQEGNGIVRSDPQPYEISPNTVPQEPINVPDAIAAIAAFPTPSLTTHSASSSSSQPNTTSAPQSPERALDSLAKLRQFKAEVEASRQTRGSIAEMEPSRLAQMAESFLAARSQEPLAALQQPHKHSVSMEDQYKLAHEQELRERLKGRQRSEEIGYKRDRYPTDDSLPIGEISKRPRAGRYEMRGAQRSSPRGLPVAMPDLRDERFTRRPPGNEAKREQSPDRHQKGRRNFITARYQKDPSANGRGSLEPCIHDRGQDHHQREPAALPMRRPNNGEHEDRSLADRISSSLPPPPRRTKSPVRAVAPSSYRAKRGPSPLHGPPRDPYGRPPSTKNYPIPKTLPGGRHVAHPYDPEPASRYNAANDEYRHTDRQPHLPPPDKGIVYDEHDRRVSVPTYGRDYECSRDRTTNHGRRGNPYARVGTEYRSPVDYEYDRRPAPPPLKPGAPVIDTNNVVETLEALKAQIAKLEKLVPVAVDVAACSVPLPTRPRNSSPPRAPSTYDRGSVPVAQPVVPGLRRDDYRAPARRDGSSPPSPTDRRSYGARSTSSVRGRGGSRGNVLGPRRGHERGRDGPRGIGGRGARGRR